jgi:P2-related tail formation protein
VCHDRTALKDDRWRLVRKIISPTFSLSKVQNEAISEEMYQCLETLKKQLTDRQRKQNGVQMPFDVDVSAKMQAFTLDIIGRTSLGLHENVYEKTNDFMHSVREFFLMSNNIAVDLAMFLPFLKAVLTFINHYLTS